MSLDADDVMMSGWRQCFCSREKQSAHQMSCGQMQIVARCVPAWLEHVIACVHIVDVLTHAHVGDIFMLVPHWVHESVCEKHVCNWGRALFYNRRDDLTRLELRLMCLCLFSAALTLCVCICVFLCVVRARMFFCWAEEHGRSEPAATRLGLKFACFPPICKPQPSHRQHCMACSWCLNQCQLRSLPMCQIGCDVRRWPARMKRFDVGPETPCSRFSSKK